MTHDDATGVASHEATDDFHNSGGVTIIVGRLKNASIKHGVDNHDWQYGWDEFTVYT